MVVVSVWLCRNGVGGTQLTGKSNNTLPDHSVQSGTDSQENK